MRSSFCEAQLSLTASLPQLSVTSGTHPTAGSVGWKYLASLGTRLGECSCHYVRMPLALATRLSHPSPHTPSGVHAARPMGWWGGCAAMTNFGRDFVYSRLNLGQRLKSMQQWQLLDLSWKINTGKRGIELFVWTRPWTWWITYTYSPCHL